MGSVQKPVFIVMAREETRAVSVWAQENIMLEITLRCARDVMHLE